MDQEILNKISYLCQRISKVEWSGVLFYTIEGSIKYPSDLKLIAKDIFLMDEGSASYTEYENDGNLIKYIMDNKLQEYQRAMIHSHNEMDSYFSGTDMEELHDNSEFNNYYLSVIVNNVGDIVAKIAMRGSQNTEHKSVLTYNDENGKLITSKDTKKTDNQTLFVLECKVTKSVNVSSDFQKQVEESIKECKKKKEEKEKEQKQLSFGFTDKADAENLLVELLTGISDSKQSLSSVLKELNDWCTSKEDIKEYIEDPKERLYYTFCGLYGREKKNVINKQINLLSKYKYLVIASIIQMLTEHKVFCYEDHDNYMDREYYKYHYV